MNKEVWYRQCTYKRETENGTKFGASWIPEKLAVVGKKIYFGKKQKKPKRVLDYCCCWSKTKRKLRN